MLFCDQINNFEDFKTRFGYKTGAEGQYLVNANGVRQRKNNIPYLFWKECVKNNVKNGYSLKDAFNKACKCNSPKDVFKYMLDDIFEKRIEDICPVPSFGEYSLLNSGICLDGDVTSIRYQNRKNGNIYKMKIGKYVNKFLEYKGANLPCWISNPTLRIFFIEEITELWKNKRLKDKTLHVVVDKDFHAIYDPGQRPENGTNFDSCMDGDDNWNYYADHEDIYDAVSLQDDEGLIYARAILVHCFDREGNAHNYLERIYCNKRMYKDLLFEKAKAEGVFDLYKGLDASCHDADEIYSVTTDRKINYRVYIPLTLEDDDWMSYQDTFKWYYPGLHKAYNANVASSRECHRLDFTQERYNTDD